MNAKENADTSEEKGKNDKDVKITLLGARVAKPGYKFIFKGGTSFCADCRLSAACLNLTKNRLYEVISIRNITHKCKLIGEIDGVVTVTVKEPQYILTENPKVAIEGATMTYAPKKCLRLDCKNYRNHCCPEWISTGDRFRIVEKLSKEKVTCLIKLPLIKVKVDRVDS